MIGNKKINKLLSFIMVSIILFTFILNNMITIVYANETPTANQMNASMISFFQQKANTIETSAIKEAELRVYGVFISNFFTPGQTQLKDLSLNDSTNELSNKILKIFFNSSTDNLGNVKELNNLVYRGISENIKNQQLTDSTGKVITGGEFLKIMANKGSVARVGGITVIDFSQESFRGAFKILAAQSAEFMMGKDYGIPAMTELYIDPFGNIWGAYDVERKSGDAVDIIKTGTDDLHLVLPAALNPLAFYSNQSGFGNTKLPLNNSFAMGSMISDSGIKTSLSDNLEAYYNIPHYFSDSDKTNALYIYGLNSPLQYIGDTDKIIDGSVTTKKLHSDIKSFIGNKRFEYSNNIKIVMGNRLDVMDKTLKDNANTLIKDTDKNFVTKNELYDLYDYLFGTHITTIDKTLSNIYYFGVDGNDSWASTEFDKLGLTGINMFGKEDIDSETLKGNGMWHVHANNTQVQSKVLSMYVDNELVLGDSPETSDISSSYINGELSRISTLLISAKPESIQELEVHKNWFISGFTGKNYIHGIVKDKDTWLYESLDAIKSNDYSGNYYVYPTLTDEVKRDVMYHTLLNYGVLGAKLNATKIRGNNITINKTSSESKTLTVMNDRVDEANWPGIYWGYMVTMLEMEKYITYDSENNVVKYDTGSFNSVYLPPLPSGLVFGGTGGISLSNISGTSGVANSENKSEEDIKKDLLKRLYGLTSDSQNGYRDSWLKNTIDGFILSTHRAITGSWLADVATVSSGAGSTYSSIVGYVNTPSLYDLPFTSWIMNNYMQIYVLALLFVIIVTIFMVLMNMRTWQQGLLVVFVMSFALLIPNIVVENTINISNKATDDIYSERFDFWALTQHQQSVNRLKGAEVSTSDIDRIITNTGEKVQNIYSQDAGVRVKWMAPKKEGYFNQLFNSKYLGDNLATNLTIFKWLFSSFIYEQEFVSNDPLATYMYRPYNSIAADAKEYYDYAKSSIQQDASKTVSSTLVGKGYNDTGNTEIPEIIHNIVDKSQGTVNEIKYSDMFIGSAYWLDKSAFTRTNEFEVYWSEAQREDIQERGSQYPNYIEQAENRTISLWGLGSDVITETILEGGSFSSREKSAGIPLELSGTLSSNSEPHLVGFYKNTESPYYYFYNTLKARYGDGISFKSALLENNIFEARDIQALSTNESTNRMVRDYLDMEGLFTNIIPYMTVANNYVYEWTKINGTDVPDFNFTLEENSADIGDDELGVAGDSDLYDSVSSQYMSAKKQRDDMEKVWMMYTPWVDQLNSLSKSTETIRIGSDRVMIYNTLNPSSYLESGRPMIFSEVDMTLKGYTQKDLTETEMRIQSVLRETYRDLMYLVNYYDLDDEVLLNAAAMYATFNFNREFSESTFIGESVMLYPQNFEMKNFNYDAFMRMIMLNATGEPIFGSQDLYVSILSKTSWFTGIMLLFVDVLAVILIPTMKIIILLMLLFLSILLCITVAVSPPEKIVSVIFKSLVVPSGLFMVVNILFAWLVSLLVGEGLTQYVGSKSISIATNDPTVTIGILIIMSITYIVAMWRIMTLLFASLKSYGMGGIIAGVGIVGAALSTGLKSATGRASRVIGATGGAITGGVTGAVMSGEGERGSGAVSGAMTGAKGRSVYLERSREQRMSAAHGQGQTQSQSGNSEYMKNKIEEKASSKNSTDTGTQVEKNQVSDNIQEKPSKQRYMNEDTTIAAKVGGAGAIFTHKAHETAVLGKERLNDGLFELKVRGGVFKHKAGEKVDNAKEKYNDSKESLQEISHKASNFASKAKSTATDIKNNPQEYASKVKSSGKKFAGTMGRRAKSGVDDYVNTTKSQIKDIDEKASQAKNNKLNEEFTKKYGYDYETKELSKHKGDTNYQGNATRKEIRNAHRKVEKQDNKNFDNVNKEVMARINRDRKG